MFTYQNGWAEARLYVGHQHMIEFDPVINKQQHAIIIKIDECEKK